MADPRLVTDVKKRLPKLSPLMQAKADNVDGSKVNMCPFGCEDEELDDFGYCGHLVGFTNDGKLMEPQVVNEFGRRQVVVATRREGKKDVPVLEPVLKTDKLVQITTSYRVYRKEIPERNNTKPIE